MKRIHWIFLLVSLGVVVVLVATAMFVFLPGKTEVVQQPPHQKAPSQPVPSESEEDAQQCVVSGCSGQLCVREAEQGVVTTGVVTTCEWKEEYACYQEAECAVQTDGECGWNPTEILEKCLKAAQASPTPISGEEIVSEEESLTGAQSEMVPETEKAESLEVSEYVNRLISWGYTPSSSRDIDTIILHSSFNSLGGDPYDVSAIVDIYESYGVGAHYIIDRKGVIYTLIQEKNIAYHAGVSELPDGRTNVNEVSIGIEIVANYEDGYTQSQYRAVRRLLDDIRSRHDIEHILGHDEIAPKRKTDPWNFDWKQVDRKE